MSGGEVVELGAVGGDLLGLLLKDWLLEVLVRLGEDELAQALGL